MSLPSESDIYDIKHTYIYTYIQLSIHIAPLLRLKSDYLTYCNPSCCPLDNRWPLADGLLQYSSLESEFIAPYRQQQLHHRLVPFPGSPKQRRPAVCILEVRVNAPVAAPPPLCASLWQPATAAFICTYPVNLVRRRPWPAAAPVPPRPSPWQSTTVASHRNSL